MKKSFRTALLCSVFMLSFGLAPAGAQESASLSEAEFVGNLWFVELSGAPTADGNSLARVQAEKAAFKKAAAAAGISYTERQSFDVLFNGYSVEIDSANRSKLATVSGVKALWPVELIQMPPIETLAGGAARAGARAIEVGASADAAARAALPARYAAGARVSAVGDGQRVRVRLAVPRLLPLLPTATVAAEAEASGGDP